MKQVWLTRGFVTLCVVCGLLVAGVGPVAADELAAGGSEDATECDLLFATAYAEIDALASPLPVDHVHEADVLVQIQAVVTELNFDVNRYSCALSLASQSSSEMDGSA